MIKRGISGGMISISSLIDKKDRSALTNNSMIKTSSSIREAAKIGLQSLYANADEVLEKYKDFDIIKEMKKRNGANLLWVRARSIDADVCNTNGDYFSEEELTKDVDYQGKKMPAYKTFEGVPIYTNHKNDNIEEAKGMVVYAEWDDDEKCVYCVFFIDEDAYPDIARGVRQGYIHDVSMGCSVDEGVCSICGNKATTERDYCDCLKKYKGKMHPSGKKAFEYNYGIKFIELSCVGDGAFESCEIIELYDQDEILQKAETAIKTAQSLNSSISLAASMNEGIYQQREVEHALRQLQNLNRSIIKIAQTAGTLVGGQLMGGTGAQNATVVKVLQGLGIDPSSSLNILDLVNLALNFLEVAVLNLFSRKDNIDLGHVAKLTKAMGELQNTLQDMIDDGIETAGQKNAQPMVPAQPQIPAQPAQPSQPGQPEQAPNAAPQLQTQTAEFEQPSVGKLIAPFSQQQYVMPIGGGVSASSNNVRLVWASSNNTADEIIETKHSKLNKLGKLAIAINNLREACGIPEKNNEVTFNVPQNDKLTASTGDKKIMDHFKKIAQDLKKQNTATLAVDIKVDDNTGNRVVLSTEKGIKGYHNGHLTNWTPNLTDVQFAQLENGDGYRVAADLLKDFSSTVRTAQKNNEIDTLIIMDEHISNGRTEQHVSIFKDLKNDHVKNDNNTYQAKLDERRHNTVEDNVMEKLLGGQQTGKLVRIVTELSNQAQKGLGHEPLEDMLHPNFGHSTVPGKEIMCNVMDGVVRTCLATKESPEKVLEFLTKSASDKNFGKILKLARLGKEAREYESIMNKFAQMDTQLEDGMKDAALTGQAPDMIGEEMQPPMEQAAIEDVADTATEETTEGEIISALTVIKENFETAVEKLTELLEKVAPEPEGKEDEMKGALEDDEMIDNNAMKGAVTGLSLAGEDMGAQPDEMINSVNSMPADNLAAGINDARLPSKAVARAKSRLTKVASKNNIESNIIGWLADVAIQNNIPTEKIALAAKLFCSYKEAARGVLNKSIRTSEIKVVDETTHSTTIYATLKDIGANVKDAAFNDKFREFAVDLLSNSGYSVDPNTFALTDICVNEDGTVCGKVSTRATKTFNPEMLSEEIITDEYVDPDRSMMSNRPELGLGDMDMETSGVGEILQPAMMVMSESYKSANRIARLQNVVKIAQGLGLPGAPGATPGGAPAAPATPQMDSLGGMAGGSADMGVGSLTGGSPDAGLGMDNINESPEPGNKAPWGTICPQCGSKDIDIANGTGNCNSCQAQLTYKFIVEVAPPDEKESGGMDMSELPEEPMAPEGGIGSAEAGMAAVPPAPATPGAPAAPATPALASNQRIMTRIAYKTSADVYANALSDGFVKEAASKLPVGMICPACGSRTASKRQKQTYCYNCGTVAVAEVKKVENEPGMLEASITWMQ